MNKWENCSKVLKKLMNAEGYKLVEVSDGEVWYQKNLISNSNNADEAILRFKKGDDLIDYYMIWGNSTYDAINDYSSSDVGDKVSTKFYEYFKGMAKLYS